MPPLKIIFLSCYIVHIYRTLQADTLITPNSTLLMGRQLHQEFYRQEDKPTKIKFTDASKVKQ